MKQEDWDKIVAYVNDFFGLEPSIERAWGKFTALWNLLVKLGLPINNKPGKVCRPTQEVKFLGIVLNSVSMTALTCFFQSDTASSCRCAAFFEGNDLFFEWTEDFPTSINVLEVYSILLAAKKWGHE